MTTLEERREWVRAGCPVLEEPRPGSARCSRCGEHAGARGPVFEDGRLINPWRMLEALGDWTDRHAGHDVGRSSGSLVRSNPGNAAVAEWAERLMAERHPDGPDSPAIRDLDGRDRYVLDRHPSYAHGGELHPEMLPIAWGGPHQTA